MLPTNIISAYQSINAFNNKTIETKDRINGCFKLSKIEANTLSKFCEALNNHDCRFELFDGYYISYSIKQISKEFDLLRFSNDLVINIELKSPLDEEKKIKKITTQMSKNYYYLKFLQKNVSIYTFVEDDGLYKYDIENNKSHLVGFEELISELSAQVIDDKLNPDDLFVPSNYLISPFNNTERFINQEYFLTGDQQTIKKQIMNLIESGENEFFCISANAGTGKTLMLYDIARTVIDLYDNQALIIHCGMLNKGHTILKENYNWNIIPISYIKQSHIDMFINQNLKVILIDEAQRIRTPQLEFIIEKAIEYKIPIVFSYDKKQYLSNNESKDLYEYVTENFKNITATKKELTNKIRTNKEMGSFITNLMKIGKSNSFLNYEAITIDYFDKLEDTKKYLDYLEKNGWKAITYTTSQYNGNALTYILSICSDNAHNVIGQEFEKVVFIMDKNFRYDEDNKLQGRGSYYSVKGMLYQIVTRVINHLKIIVLDNPNLYCKLMEIKTMGKE